jgi:alpha-L-fucosidase 2
VKLFVLGERGRDWARLREELAKLVLAAGADYDGLLERHIALHRPLYRSASLSLEGDAQDDRSNERLLLDAYAGEASAPLVRKMWAYGRYLFISGTSAEEGAEPFGLYGLWGGDYRLVWSHNMANENIQTISAIMPGSCTAAGASTFRPARRPASASRIRLCRLF